MEVLNFADDTLIYQKISKYDYNDTEHLINLELTKVSTWMRSNQWCHAMASLASREPLPKPKK